MRLKSRLLTGTVGCFKAFARSRTIRRIAMERVSEWEGRVVNARPRRMCGYGAVRR